MKIREYSESDLEGVISLWNECGLTVPWNDPRKDISRKLQEQPDLFLVGEINGNVIASGMGGYDGHRGSIYYLAVSPQFRKTGFGKEIMKEIEDRLLELGCPKINLLIRTSNEQVIEFYKGLDYKTDPVVCVGKRLVPDV